ncbi:YeiH family protein [Acidovorax sp. MR-S7]|uniref:YeiH family protein n=1 Tax=Acidovorax sp. MR-S7 TaxID=1268622 RepID=UPI00037B88C1|nr:putative sulfate exporter family transporter [Acidovorax sp. MR-S7]GAD24556.1 predicted membrane protein [Acidovorax sp. MR-S7]
MFRHITDAQALHKRTWFARHLRLFPGIGLSAVVAAAAALATSQYGGPVFLYALLIGVALHHVSEEPRSAPGIEFCARTLLRLGVGLLGARITAQQIIQLGWSTALIVVVGVATTIGLAVFVGRRLRFSPAQSVLAGGAVAICGASAALAISAVLPKEKDGDRHTLMVVVSVTVMSTIAMVLYPLLSSGLGLQAQIAGVFIGGTIHDVAQVVGAGYTLGQETGDVATVVKLFRVALLTVVVFLTALAFKRSKGQEASPDAKKSPPLVPWFLLLFIVMVGINSFHFLPQVAVRGLSEMSQLLLILAVAALGLKTSFRELTNAGWRPIALIVIETLWLAAIVLGLLYLRQR